MRPVSAPARGRVSCRPPVVRPRSEPRMHRLSAALVLLTLCGRPALGQAPYSLRWGDAVSVFAAGVTAFIPEAMKLPKAAPSCAPCDPTSLPSIDRSALHTFSGSAATPPRAACLGGGGGGGHPSPSGAPAPRRPRGGPPFARSTACLP